MDLTGFKFCPCHLKKQHRFGTVYVKTRINVRGKPTLIPYRTSSINIQLYLDYDPNLKYRTGTKKKLDAKFYFRENV